MPIERRVQAPTALDSRLRSTSSFPLKRRGHLSDSHRSLTMISSARPSSSTAHTSRLAALNWWKLRPHLRHLYSNVDPQSGDQPSILTAKSWPIVQCCHLVSGLADQVAVQVHARIAPPDVGPCHFLAMGQLRS